MLRGFREEISKDEGYREVRARVCRALQEAMARALGNPTAGHGDWVVGVIYCKWGKHRSVAMAEDVRDSLAEDPGRALELHVMHLERPRWDRAFRSTRGFGPDQSLPVSAALEKASRGNPGQQFDPAYVPAQRTWLKVLRGDPVRVKDWSLAPTSPEIPAFFNPGRSHSWAAGRGGSPPARGRAGSAGTRTAGGRA
jgi:hypothetical protein